jgi:carbon-monoxide dehydrogenase large subunit
MDPVEVRRRNLIPPEAFPYVTTTGETYDVGDYERVMDQALRLADHDRLRREQAARRSRGDRLALGIGLAVYVEVTGMGRKELGAVQVEPDGSVTVRVGTSSHGQGHETAFAQVAAGVLGVPIEAVRVLHSDTAVVARGEGTWASRSLQIAGSSVFEAAETVVDRARLLAAHLLEAEPEDVALLPGGRLGVAGAPEVSLGWAELAAAAADRPDGFEPLAAETRRYQKEHSFPFGAHVAVVEVDLETGDVRLVRHVAVDDCGRILNPMLVEGQVHGGLGQGIGQALFEEVVFDGSGTPLTSNLSTYQIPAAAELPSFVTGRSETPTPLNPLGAKGIGESATIGSTPAVLNAAVDALAHLGIRHLDPPLQPERVWRAIAEASGR